MAAKTISISYDPQVQSGVSPITVVIDNFADNALPRSRVGNIDFSQSANGTSILSGPAVAQKFQWVISAILTKTKAESLDNLFGYWDEDRADGRAAACGIVDTTWKSSLTTSAVFITPPVFTYLNDNLITVSFGLQQV